MTCVGRRVLQELCCLTLREQARRQPANRQTKVPSWVHEMEAMFNQLMMRKSATRMTNHDGSLQNIDDDEDDNDYKKHYVKSVAEAAHRASNDRQILLSMISQ